MITNKTKQKGRNKPPSGRDQNLEKLYYLNVQFLIKWSIKYAKKQGSVPHMQKKKKKAVYFQKFLNVPTCWT